MSFESLNDQGIMLEIFGFILLLLTGNRSPGRHSLVTEDSVISPFDIFRSKIIPNKHVYWVFIVGIAFVIIGLVWQFSIFQTN